MSDAQPETPDADSRLYVLDPETWTTSIKLNWEKEYCYFQTPGQDYFHLLLCGEIYLQGKIEKCCLQCGLRRGIITNDRLYWQREPDAIDLSE